MQTPTMTVPFEQSLANLFPQAVTPAGIILPHDPYHTVIARQHGIEVPSPISTHYRWPHPPSKPPFAVQKTTTEMLTENPRAYVLSGMGVGKTVCPVWAFDYLKSINMADKMLVACPLSTMSFTWLREFFDFTPGRRAVVLHGSKQRRLKLLAQDYDAYIINHDGVDVIYDELMDRKDIDTLTIDEIAVYRNNNPRSKRMRRFATHFKWGWGLTGAPTPQAVTDVWGIAQVLTPSTVTKYFTRFREELMVKVTPFKWLPRPGAKEMAYKVLQPSVRFALEDVTELPMYISRRIDIDLGPRQKEIYHAVKQHCRGLIDQHVITAANAAAAMSKLLQISLGYVYDATKGIVELDNGARLDALTDIIDSAEGKVIVVSVFKHALAGIQRAIEKAGHKALQISGDTPPGKRPGIFDEFQNGVEYKVLNGHPQCFAHGVTLTAADTVVWFGPTTSLEIYDQLNARIRRVGQMRKQQFLHLQATPVEEKLYSLTINKQQSQEGLLALFRDD